MNTIEELFQEEIRDLYSAETQLLKALPKMIKAANSDKLKAAIEAHLEETRTHVERLEQIASELEFKPTGKTCRAMKGLIEEGSESAEETGNPQVIDAAIIAAAQRVEHYEISGYGSAKALAQELGLTDVVSLLETTKAEEAAADEQLTEVAETHIYVDAPLRDEEDSSENEPGGRSKRFQSNRRRQDSHKN